VVLEREFGNLDDKLDILDGKIDAEKDRITREMKVLAEDVQNDIQFILDLTIVLTFLAAGIAVAIGMYMSSSVSKPITRLKEAVDQIAKGNFDASTNVSSSRDEIGQLCMHLGKMKEELKNKGKMQNEFVSIASHELRTPVQSILGFARLAEGEKTKVDQALKVIVSEAKRLESLTNDILDVSRLESDSITYDMDRVGINDLIAGLAKAFSVSLGEDVKLKMKLDKTCPAVYADKTRINQVLSNVLGNAIKFTAKGEISVETHYLEDKDLVEIRITDTGRGIPADLIPKLFSKFVTQDVKNENRQGTGLGLYISKAIVTAHGGEIFAENNENGLGASFTVLLPVYASGSKQGNASDINKVAASS
jgi:signal transduction histidine kinase